LSGYLQVSPLKSAFLYPNSTKLRNLPHTENQKVLYIASSRYSKDNKNTTFFYETTQRQRKRQPE